MLKTDNNLLDKWQHALHYQWQDIQYSEPVSSVNFAIGGPVGIIQLRGKIEDADFMSACEQTLGVSLPTVAKHIAQNEHLAVLWISPDEWQVVCNYKQKEDLCAKLCDALANVYSQVADNTSGYTFMQLQGEDATTVLRHITTYDVQSLPVGQCAQTLSLKTVIMFIKVDENKYNLIYRRSFSDYIWKILEKSATAYGYAVHKSWLTNLDYASASKWNAVLI